MSIIEEVTPVTPQNAMLLAHISYLRWLMDDCMSFEWHQVRTAHRQVLSEIEHHRLKWDNTAAVKESKAVALQRVCGKIEATSTVTQSELPLTVPCPAFQKGTCSQQGDHMADGQLAFHSCSRCFKKTGARHPHAQKGCRKYNNRNKPKNGKTGTREA